eukprot:m.84589 g.84589  ORF g.84589 m.84589 type:complete len:53 (-) comp14691_c0_seq3:28-186(-)
MEPIGAASRAILLYVFGWLSNPNLIDIIEIDRRFGCHKKARYTVPAFNPPLN